MNKEIPILFSTEMVKAIRDRGKSQTRRVMKPQPSPDWAPDHYGEVHKMRNGEFVMRNGEPVVIGWGASNYGGSEAYVSPYKVGDVLWVRETFYKNYNGKIIYRADQNSAPYNDNAAWRPSIFMPREAARMFLRVTDVRAERLQDITEADAMAEGVNLYCNYDGTFGGHGAPMTYREGYRLLWDFLNLKRGYGSNVNPWVWVIIFEHLKDYKGAI